MIDLPDVPENIDKKLREFLTALKIKVESPEEPKLKTFSVQQLNALTAANYTNRVVVCTNGNAGDECLAYCNGRAWFVIELGDRVSFS